MSNPLVLFGSLVALLAWSHGPTLGFLYEKWVGDPQYSHGFLVPIFSAYLLNQNRERFSTATFRALPWIGGGIVVFSLAMRILAGGLLFHQLDAIALLVSLAGLVVAFGGVQFLKLTGPAILFLAFAIPLPYEMERNLGGPVRRPDA